ncbi:MAG: alpha-1,2-fucosyltransferase [Lachnospiraceae bacterium]|nr:alpha-1,2-fucosyltransferase [Lachnospiraceae bacterium]
MIIIEMSGGLGNQMFQYALYETLSSHGKDVRMDEYTGFHDDPQRDPVLGEIFSLTYQKASRQEVLDLKDADRSIHNWLRRRFTGGHGKILTEPASGNFDPRVLECDNTYLEGYWQSERYFSDPAVQQKLRRVFALSPDRVLRSPAQRELLQRIEDAESVSIHIRRGDYLLPGVVETFGDICTEDYYRRAIDYMLERYPRAVFFLFSNDLAWTAEHFDGERFVTVGATDDVGDDTHLFLMSRCRHHVIANSSFSWWGAWLDARQEKTVIAPKKWINTKEMKDIYTENMIRL